MHQQQQRPLQHLHHQYTSVVAVLLVMWCSISTSTVTADYIVYPTKTGVVHHHQTSCTRPTLHKIELVQNMYVQYDEFVTSVPRLQGFSACYWITVQDPMRGATPLNYGLDEDQNTDNLTITYRPNEGSWTLNVNGDRVYNAHMPLLVANRWTHQCHSWSGLSGQWSVWQDGRLMQSGVARHSVGWVVPGGGVMVAGQHQNTINNMGMDRGEGVVGSLTMIQVSSFPLPHPHATSAVLKVRQLANECTAADRGDVVGWLSTPRRGFGGAITKLANSKCGYF